ncbi:MAG: hypothetical protein IPL97_02200 [Niastella sp.]|nr:hypothetical protein [Niastella sp.]
MSNIIIAVINKLGMDAFSKISPNLEKEGDVSHFNKRKKEMEQALVTSVLAGLYKFGSTDKGANYLSNNPASDDLLKDIFGEHKDGIVNALANYCNIHTSDTNELMNKIGQVAVHTLKEEAGTDAIKIRSYLAGQRHNILVYLPPDLQVGSLIKDDTIDDNTNKMEGPVSGLMHFFENLFAEKDTHKAT